jgi:F0F1-type ATP synthase gamma subunit
MNKLIALKKRHHSIEIIQRQSHATNVSASLDFQRVQQKIKQYKSINEIIINNSYELTKNFMQTLQKKTHNKSTTAAILIGYNKGMCGKFRYDIDSHYKTHKTQYDFWFLFGEKMKKFAIDGDNVKVCKNTQSTLLQETDKILRVVSENCISEVSLIYYCNKSIKIDSVISCKQFVSKKTPHNLYDYSEDFMRLYLVKLIHTASLHSAIVETTQRLITTNKAENNAKNIANDILTQCNQIRQNAITDEICELART